MSYDFEIICLANSRKHSGRCIAGKIINGERQGEWIRPVGTSVSREITERDRGYDDGTTAQHLDLIDITFTAPQAPSFQSENHVIDDGTYWDKTGQGAITDLAGLVDAPPTLWENGHSSFSGTNDRVPENLLTAPRQTLFLIAPNNVSIKVSAEGAAFGDSKRSVRATFTYNRQIYSLKVTDPAVEQHYKGLGNGVYSPAEISYFTVSLGETWDGYAYKLIAAVF
ncbi:dual OB domain-containing protein [Pseudomonas pergaminensis]